jgi:hypothetical protein
MNTQGRTHENFTPNLAHTLCLSDIDNNYSFVEFYEWLFVLNIKYGCATQIIYNRGQNNIASIHSKSHQK